MVYSPVIEAAVDDGVVHGRTHSQPHAGQVDLLDELLKVEVWVDVGQEEEDVEGQPADGEGTHNHDHHFDHLGRGHSRQVYQHCAVASLLSLTLYRVGGSGGVYNTVF